MMQKIILVSFVFLFLGLAPHALAAPGDFVPLAPIPGLTEGATADAGGLATFFNNLYKFAIGIAAALAVIMIIWGGLEISTKDSVSKQSDGKERITQAIIGLILVLSPVLVFSIINPSILNLSLNLPPLDTKSGAPAGGGSGGGAGAQTTSTADANGCNVTGTVLALQRAICPSLEAAQAFVSECKSYGHYGSLAPPLTQPSSKETCRLVDGERVCTESVQVVAVCEKKLSGTYTVINLGSLIYQKLQVVGDGASDYTNFAASCAQSGGSFYGSESLFSISCPSTLNITLQPGQSGSCYKLSSIYCKAPGVDSHGGRMWEQWAQ